MSPSLIYFVGRFIVLHCERNSGRTVKVRANFACDRFDAAFQAYISQSVRVGRGQCDGGVIPATKESRLRDFLIPLSNSECAINLCLKSQIFKGAIVGVAFCGRPFVDKCNVSNDGRPQRAALQLPYDELPSLNWLTTRAPHQTTRMIQSIRHHVLSVRSVISDQRPHRCYRPKSRRLPSRNCSPLQDW